MPVFYLNMFNQYEISEIFVILDIKLNKEMEGLRNKYEAIVKWEETLYVDAKSNKDTQNRQIMSHCRHH